MIDFILHDPKGDYDQIKLLISAMDLDAKIYWTCHCGQRLSGYPDGWAYCWRYRCGKHIKSPLYDLIESNGI